MPHGKWKPSEKFRILIGPSIIFEYPHFFSFFSSKRFWSLKLIKRQVFILFILMDSQTIEVWDILGCESVCLNPQLYSHTWGSKVDLKPRSAVCLKGSTTSIIPSRLKPVKFVTCNIRPWGQKKSPENNCCSCIGESFLCLFAHYADEFVLLSNRRPRIRCIISAGAARGPSPSAKRPMPQCLPVSRAPGPLVTK